MSFWDYWFRRWRRERHPFFEEMDRMFEDMFREIEELPKELQRERRLPDGSVIRTFGPVVYGYSMSIGPDGRPIIREFGNLRPSRFGLPKATKEREPLVDVTSGDRVVQVVAEVPGVNKEDIELEGTEDTLTIRVDTEKRKYYKVVDLPEKVDPNSAKASYKNGVLEVTLNKLVARKPSGRRIRVE